MAYNSGKVCQYWTQDTEHSWPSCFLFFAFAQMNYSGCYQATPVQTLFLKRTPLYHISSTVGQSNATETTTTLRMKTVGHPTGPARLHVSSHPKKSKTSCKPADYRHTRARSARCMKTSQYTQGRRTRILRKETAHWRTFLNLHLNLSGSPMNLATDTQSLHCDYCKS